MSDGYRYFGKQVFRDGVHIADAVTETAAADLAWLGNHHIALHKAASAYFHATTDRTARLAAPALRDLLARPSPSSEAA